MDTNGWATPNQSRRAGRSRGGRQADVSESRAASAPDSPGARRCRARSQEGESRGDSASGDALRPESANRSVLPGAATREPRGVLRLIRGWPTEALRIVEEMVTQRDTKSSPARRGERVHLVLFHSEGPPHDAGTPLRREAELLRTRVHGTFDSVRISTPRALRRRDASWEPLLADYRDWVESRPDYFPGLPWNPSWAANGFLAWKPRLILERLRDDDVSDGDIVVYHDSNVTKYPQYLEGARRWSSYQRRRMHGRSVLLFIDGVSDLRQDVKHELLSEFLDDLPQRFVPSVWAGCLAVRRDDEGIRFVSEWADLSSDLRRVSPVTAPPFDPRFIWNTGEQATLDVLWHSRIAAGDDRAIRTTNLRGRRAIPPASPVSWSALRFEIVARSPRVAGILRRAKRALEGPIDGAAAT